MSSNGSTRGERQAKCKACGQTAGYNHDKTLVWKEEDLEFQKHLKERVNLKF